MNIPIEQTAKDIKYEPMLWLRFTSVKACAGSSFFQFRSRSYQNREHILETKKQDIKSLVKVQLSTAAAGAERVWIDDDNLTGPEAEPVGLPELTQAFICALPRGANQAG